MAMAGAFALLLLLGSVPVSAQAQEPPASLGEVAPVGDPCDRLCLEGIIDRYLEALVAHDPTRLPLAREIKTTENGQRLEVGDGLWNTASGLGSYRLLVADPEAGQAAFLGTIRENGNPAILALRLKVAEGAILEVEKLVARTEEDAERLEQVGSPHPCFVTSVPASERASREALVATANMYFVGLERNDGKGVYPFTDDCNRLENGKQTTNNPSEEPQAFDIQALGCREQFETGFFRFVTRIRDRRFVLVDPERGLALAFVFFDHAGNVTSVELANGMTIPIGVSRPWTWEIAELFKVEKGLIRQIEAVVRESPYGMSSGWSTWEEGLSTRPR
jgi:hypothetical protein